MNNKKDSYKTRAKATANRGNGTASTRHPVAPVLIRTTARSRARNLTGTCGAGFFPFIQT